MITPTHIVGGALLYASIAHATGAPEWVVGTSGSIGGLIGGAPDVIPWAAWRLGLEEKHYGKLYLACHDGGRIDRLWRWTLAWGLHTQADRLVHPPLMRATHGWRYWLNWVSFEALHWALNLWTIYWLTI